MQIDVIDTDIQKVTHNMPSRLFDEEEMYTYIETFCSSKGLSQTVRVLPYVKEKHEGQFRKSVKINDFGNPEKIPYINHPLLMTCHAISLGLLDDSLLSAMLLHDVCEDCGVLVSELPVNDETKEIVRLVTKTEDFDTPGGDKRYFEAIANNTKASLVKIIDRCNNLSGMTSCYTEKRMAEYILETNTYIMPLLEKIHIEHPEYSHEVFLIKYHMSSIIDSIRHYMARKM